MNSPSFSRLTCVTVTSRRNSRRHHARASSKGSLGPTAPMGEPIGKPWEKLANHGKTIGKNKGFLRRKDPLRKPHWF